MLTIEREADRAIIDVRPIVARGEHPKNALLQFIQEEPEGTIIEIHVPFRAEPLIAAISSLGLDVTVTELATNHFLLRALKL